MELRIESLDKEGIEPSKWQENLAELDRIKGVEAGFVRLNPPEIGKVRMLRIAFNLYAAKRNEAPISDDEMMALFAPKH